jgi:Fur family ferric uptake transcriptional regulator
MSIRIRSCPTEERILRRYCSDNGLHMSDRRVDVLQVFLSVDRHVTAEELFKLMHELGTPVSYATVYRTLRLLVASGLARKVSLGGRSSRFERALGHGHHDHLVCSACGRTVEFYHPLLEKLQTDAAREKGFVARSHTLTIHGLCSRCAAREDRGDAKETRSERAAG